MRITMKAVNASSGTSDRKKRIKKELHYFWEQRYMHILLLPAIIYFIVFCYAPMYGLVIAFKEFSYTKGIMGSPWVGLANFESFFNSMYFFRLIKNTVVLSLSNTLISFPIPIIFALLLNEVRNSKFRNTIQTISYFPHFVSIVIVVGMMHTLLSPEDGMLNNFLGIFGIEPIPFMQSSAWFRPLYIISGIWQGFGWGSIIYLAALTGIAPELYEAAEIDGASRFQKVTHISLPSIMPTIMIMLILALGGVMNVGFEKVMLMYNPGIYDIADVISTYVYRKSIEGGEFSFGTAVDLFNNVINFILIVFVNQISKKISEVSLW